MHVLDLTCIYPNKVFDSEGRSVASLDRALVAAGFEVTTLVLRPWAPQWLAKRVPRYLHLAAPDGVQNAQRHQVIFSHYPHVPWLPNRYRFGLNIRLMANEASNRCRNFDVTCDIILAQGVTAGLAAERLAESLQVPFAVILNDDLRHLGSTDSRPFLPRYRGMFSRAAAIFAIGPGQIRAAPDYLCPDDLVKLILAPHGVDLDDLQAVVGRFPPRPSKSRPEIVSVGSLFRWKAIHENLYAMKQLVKQGLDKWHYTIVGDGPYRPELEQLAQELGLSRFVNFAGHVSHEQALHYMYESDIFCLPSWREAFGLVFTEAAVCGVPAIGCLENGPEIIIRDGETGLLVPPRDVKALAGALTFLLEHPERAKEMGRNAQEHVKSLTWERTAQIYADTFRRVLGGGAAAPLSGPGPNVIPESAP